MIHEPAMAWSLGTILADTCTQGLEQVPQGKEITMQTALKLDMCACGIHSDTSCAGCGAPVCRRCGHQEIASSDPAHIVLTHYCHACMADPRKNTWGTLYWDGLKAMYI
jgi:hypothetical protein